MATRGGSNLKPAQNSGRDPKPLTPRQWESVTKSLLDLVVKTDGAGGSLPREGSKGSAPRNDKNS